MLCRARQQACQRQRRNQFFYGAPHEKAPIPREMPRRIHLQKGSVFSGAPEKRPASFVIIIPHCPDLRHSHLIQKSTSVLGSLPETEAFSYFAALYAAGGSAQPFFIARHAVEQRLQPGNICAQGHAHKALADSAERRAGDDGGAVARQ